MEFNITIQNQKRKFKDKKGVIRGRKSKKDKQYNDKMKKEQKDNIYKNDM